VPEGLGGMIARSFSSVSPVSCGLLHMILLAKLQCLAFHSACYSTALY